MDHARFGDLTKRFAAARTRRAAARAIAGLAAAALIGGAAGGPGPAAAAFCRFPGQECSSDGQCCALSCADGVCGCKPKGATCYQKFGLSCCSKKCRRGKCR